MAKSNRGKKSRRKNWDDKSSQRNKREEMREQASQREDYNRSSLNDISWYARNPMLLQAAGSFPYPYRPGMSLPLVNQYTQTTGLPAKYSEDYIPGVLSIVWMPSFGNSESSSDPASVSAQEFYTRVRAAYTGSLDADAPDFMIYIGALDSVYTYIGWLKRLYRAVSTYSEENFALPNGILRAMGLTNSQISDLRYNKTHLWQGINELILMSRRFKCPAVMDLMNRHYWMSDNVYADAPTTRAQLYVFNPIGVYKLAMLKEVSTGTEDVMGLQMTKIPTVKSGDSTFTQTLLDFGFSLLEAIDAWDDGYTISGYLRKAYDGVPSFTVAELLQDELITAQFVPEVLSQIENARPALVTSWAINNVIQNALPQITVNQNVATNAVVSNINLKLPKTNADQVAEILATNFPSGINPMLNIHSDSPTVSDSVIASRLQSHTLVTKVSDGFEVDIVAGTEVVLYFNLVTGTGSSWGINNIGWISLINFPVNPPEASSFTLAYQQLEMFDWHPFLYVLSEWTGSTHCTPMGDVYNPTVIQRNDLANLHRICMYSELNSFAL